MQQSNKKTKVSKGDAQRAFFAGDRYKKVTAAMKPARPEAGLRSLDVQSLSMSLVTAGGAEDMNPTYIPQHDFLAPQTKDTSFDRPALAIPSPTFPTPPPASFVSPSSAANVKTPKEHLFLKSLPKENRILFIDQNVDRTDEIYKNNTNEF